MLTQIQAIIWKEWREFFFQQSIKNKLQTIVLISALGILLPLNKGAQWFDMPFFYGIAIMGPLLSATTILSDLFAGERERHTLETLMASKLSFRAIVLGKILFSVTYASGITIVLLLLNIITLNIVYYSGEFIVFSINSALILSAINFAMAFFTTLLGVAVTMGAKTVKQGQLTITVSVISLALLPSLLIKSLPDSFKNTFLQYYISLSSEIVIFMGVIIMIIICTVMLKYLFYRFKKLSMYL